MSSYILLNGLKEIMCTHIGTHYTLVPISHLSSPLVKVERIWESIIVKWHFFLRGQGAFGFANIFTSKAYIIGPLDDPPPHKREH